MDAELIAHLDQGFAGLRGEIAALRQDVRADLAATADQLRAEIVASAERLRTEISANTTRHIDVVIEALVSKMELIVEGVRTVDRRLDRFGDEVRDELQKVDRRPLRLHARIGARRRRRRGH